MFKPALLLLLIVGAFAQSGSIQILPSNPTLYSSSNYIVNYYPFLNMPSNTTFSLNFASTYITVPTGTLNVTATVSGTAITGATGSCTSSTCVLRLNRFVSATSPITFTIGSFVNPYFLRTQAGNATITYNSSYVENQAFSIQADQYTPMAITSNSLKQSDYGVGNYGVNYVFNFSVPMSPSNVQLSITIPPQVSVGSLQTSLIYYGTVVYVSPVFVNNIIVLTFNATSTNSSGIVLLNISGLINPQSIGNSSSFSLQILIPTLPGTFSSCSNCAVAQLTNNLFARSTVAGNIEAINLYSSNPLISQANNITIYSKLYASIPTGGIYQILLPSSVKPVLPVYCTNSYGFTLTTATPSCSYNATNNAIYTNNFVFSGTGSVVITVAIVNPPDTTLANFYFQSFDSNANMIGNSTLAYAIQAVPLVLTASAAKTNYQVETNFNLTVNATLGVALTSTNRIQVILPQANYNVSSISCSTGVTIPCTTSIDPLTQNLTITLSPPCTQCTAGSIISFAINGLTNPSYINSYSQTVIVQSTTTTGIIQTNPLSLTINPSALIITNYARSGSNSVGSSYSLTFTYSISNYINTNGGQLLLNFNQYDTYVNPSYSSGQYTYPSSLTITDPQNNQYSNSIIYYTSSNPNSIQQIAINICGGSNCAGSITITGLRKGFNTLTALTQNIQITSQGGDLVSTSTFNIMQYNVAKVTPTLKLNLTNSVTTLNSNYVIDFISSNIPFQSGLSFTLSSLHTINGGCFMTHNSSIFNGVFSCQVVNSTSISLTYTGDITLMMIDVIDYTLTIINITNPISIVPLTYSLSSQFANTVNQQFSTTYSIATPFPLTFLYTKSNNTFGQAAVLNVTVVSNYPAFNQIKMSVPSGLLTVLPSQTSVYQAAMINNVYQITQIYSLTNQTVTLSIINPNSTNINGAVSFSMYSSGYLSATGTVTIQTVVPMFLGMSAVSTSRVVGDVSNLTVTFNRVNSYSSENQFLLNFSSSLFDYTSALYNNAPVVFPISVPIGLTSITITNLKNLLFVPLTTPNNSISAWTVDGSGYVVAVSSYVPTGLLPNTPASGMSCSFTRTNTVINGVGSITINYTPRFPTSAGIMNVNMPTNQASIVSPSCSMLGSSNNANNCTVLSSNTTSIFLTYFNQTSTSLSNILNIQPNSNLMSVYIYTSNNELVEFLTAAITPTIQYNQLTIAGNISSTIVASNSQLLLNITSPSPIDVGSKIVINLPNNTFSRVTALVTQDCTYTINGANFTGCQYGLSGIWLTQTNISFLGSSQLPANTNILLTIYVTNAWSVTAFAAQAISLFVSNAGDNYVAQGSISLANIYGGIPSLVTSAINTPVLSQSSNLANAANSITINFTLPVPLPTGSSILLSIPKSAYVLSSTNLAAISNLQSQSSNSTSYVLTLSTSCLQSSPLCNFANSLYSLTIALQNNPYVAIATNQLSFQVNLGSNVISSQMTLTIPALVAQTLSAASISRSNLNAFAATNVTITINNPNAVSNFTVIVSPFVKPTATLPLVLAPTLATSNSQTLTYQLNSSNHISVNVTSASGSTSNIIISGQNNLLVSVAPEVYTVTIMDANYIYFTGQITASDALVPYSSGLSLQRINTTVGQSTNVYLYGNLPASIPSLTVPFNGNNFTVAGTTFNVSLGTIVNSKNVSDSSAFPISIKNIDFIAYSSSLILTPVLTTQNLTGFMTLAMPTTVNVGSNYSISVNLNQTSLSYLSIKTPIFFKSMVKCCIDATCTQTLIQSCTFAPQVSNNFIELWLTSAQNLTNVTFVVTALDYQSTFTNQTISIMSALPTSSISVVAGLNIAAVNITSTLALQNWKVNTVNTYTLNVQPIAKSGYLSITLPSFISTQLSSSVGVTLTVNGTVTPTSMSSQNGQSVLILPITFSTTNVSLLLTSVLNPVDNTPYSITIQQAADSAFTNIYGYSTLNVVMNHFDSITLISAVRVVTKVNSLTDIIMEITAPYDNTQLVIVFPPSQLFTTSSCSIFANESVSVPCQVVNSTAIITSSMTGTNRYTITGLQNQKFYDPTTTGDLITAQIGIPYLRATTIPSTSTLVSPHLTLGSITMNSFTSSNPTLLNPTTLTYKITIENTNNINGFILQFAKYYYIFTPKTSCSINGSSIPCSTVDNQTLFLSYANASSNSLVVVVSNIINYVKPANWTFKSVQTHLNNGVTIFSDVDLYYNDGTTLTALQASTMKMRVILPFNHVQSSPVTFNTIIDSQYSSLLPLNSFALNFTTQNYACQLLASNFVSTLTISCTFSTSASYNMKVQLYHTQFPNTPLSVGTSNLFIYPSPSNSCSNQMCDSCSMANGVEYCFACREGLYSSNGECSNSCQGGYFPYSNTNICQQCSPTCSSCFGLYSSNCLSCSNSTFALSSGNCVENCEGGNFAYNGFCVENQECSSVSGCRLCANTGFCYQCLPDYSGAPTCKYTNVMPATIMIYVVAPFAVLAIVSIIVAAAKCVGAESLLSQTIFSFSFLQLFAWTLTIPIMGNVMTAMVLVSFLTLRVIISIVSYQVYYKKNLGELSQKLLEEESQKEIQGSEKKEDKEEKSDLDNWKTKLVRLIAHFNGPDSYELLRSKISEPVLAVNHSLAIQAIFMANRWLVCILMFYMLSVATIGDSILMPLLNICTGGILTICRLLTWQKARRCLSCFRG